MRIMREETFGPVLHVMAFDTDEEAVRLANDSEYGLAASVFTDDDARGQRLARRIQAGTVMVNDVISCFGISEAPHGGVKMSGIGRTHGRLGLAALFAGFLSMGLRTGRVETPMLDRVRIVKLQGLVEEVDIRPVGARLILGVVDAGFNTTVQPAASAGETFRVIIEFGKFHGVMAPQTPIGCRIASRRASGRWVGIVSP